MKTKTLIVNVMDAPIPSGQEYIYTSYPADGLYLTTNGILILRQNTMALCMTMPPQASWVTPVESEPPQTRISEITMLKAIALVQKPELALEMFK